MRVIRRDSLRATRWKNGGGETREIACFPPASRLNDFEWRLSTAVVAQDGEFSIFEGVDRRLYLLEGGGLRLRFGSRDVRQFNKGEHVDFSGDTPVYVSLVEGPVLDINIMVRRDKHRAHFEHLSISGSANIVLPWETVAVFVRAGQMNLGSGSGVSLAHPFDTVILDEGHPDRIVVDGSAEIIVVGFDALR